MGYSTYIVCQNKKLQNKMYNFISKQEWLKEHKWIAKDRTLAYWNKKPLSLGYNTGASDENYYIVQWMALRIGIKYNIRSKFSCFFYDFEKCKVQAKSFYELILHIKNKKPFMLRDEEYLKNTVDILFKLEKLWYEMI